MPFLRLVLSAIVGALLALSLFAAMGQATAPATVMAQTLKRYPDLDWQPLGAVQIDDGKALWRGVTRPRWTPVPVTSLGWDEQVAPPRFDTETVVDPAHLTPELVVMSRTLATTEAVSERRWWRSLFHKLGD